MTTNDQPKTTLQQAFETIDKHVDEALAELNTALPGVVEDFDHSPTGIRLPVDIDLQQVAEYATEVIAWQERHSELFRDLRIISDVRQTLVNRSDKIKLELSEKFERLALNR